MTNAQEAWSITPATNGSADANVAMADGTLFGADHGAGRNIMARVAAFIKSLNGSITSGGSANAQTFTSPSGHAFTALAAGMVLKFKAGYTNTAAATLAVDGLTAKNVYRDGLALFGGEIIAGQVYEVVYDGTQFQLLGSRSSFSPLNICEGRLTLATAVPVTVSDVTAATTIYFTPYQGNRIALFDGTSWALFSFSEISIAVPATTSQMYDVWAYSNAGAVALEALAWTNDTTRATALALQNGVLSKTGALTRRYVGSFRTTGVSGQTEDSKAKRFVWNMYNRRPRAMLVYPTVDSYNYTTATVRQMNGDAANQLDFIRGLDEDVIFARAQQLFANSNIAVIVRGGIGLDSTTTLTGLIGFGMSQVTNQQLQMVSSYSGLPGLGRHYLSLNEISSATGTTAWYGDSGAPTLFQAGISGEMMG